ncbi:hypothetical protein PF005_g30094 [Phytophthora fragariae]|uniref:Uncharacterized protein n=1 Tax=Phytophthora fragariae TaxID=53985 RepID=A0A6A3QIW4_9STRA|nr:hypothetical protein PF003_g16161 [Phytophthora fragariae]KAE8924195.1 hypothetical protein PF009_g25570 [Phytophthora fragariae]KAE8972721.1 hypothetical protein PF011_g25536 [Phytophthora fragariae]KAE9076106.1 hypothetical protein PF006_g28200 [Phytophthora fragariae]KAE9077528.1 hypothetical protein PF007_g24215 [Phytophthora fragariae]
MAKTRSTAGSSSQSSLGCCKNPPTRRTPYTIAPLLQNLVTPVSLLLHPMTALLLQNPVTPMLPQNLVKRKLRVLTKPS